jgi:hypothetical protein
MQSTDTERTPAEMVREYQAQTTGSQRFIHHHFPPIIYTEGVEFLAETCGAFWLIDLIASYQPELQREEFQLWTLEYDTAAEVWRITAYTDSPGSGRRLARQGIGYSDFPKELSPFKLYVEAGTLLLPEEH